ncbi:transfer RNA methyltransferase [Ascosphaera apis ARSEF 7405]|uniref:Transfer RNA methyltransferase n=1 Tax=Ascosphaera apis ARSEF 7405 TaxID=392613 RepID=A0A167VC67_9EURO|nr:transfer RNA methyltransferase [Ascosphaera apis ARSEF 7405]
MGKSSKDKRDAYYQKVDECVQEKDEQPEEDESKKLKPRKNVKIVSIDLQPMTPLEGITTLKADITHPSTIPLLLKSLDPDTYDESSGTKSNPVDLVLSDGAPDVTGLHDLDIYIQSQLLYAALNLAIQVLRPGGKPSSVVSLSPNHDQVVQAV